MVNYNKEELEKLILVENKSYSEIGRMYGVTDSAIKKVAKKYGIILPKRRKVNATENFSHPNTNFNSLVFKIDDETFKYIIQNSTQWKEIGKKLGYKSNPSTNVREQIKKRCSMLGMELNIEICDDISKRTKKEMFDKCNTWQAARSQIRRNAQKFFTYYNPNAKCAICGYDKHIEVAHIKSVSSFVETATIEEINSIDNLIALCPNHHWEYDNGVLKL